MARPVCLVLVLIAAAVGVSACGGGGDDVGASNAYVRAVNTAQDRFLRSAQAAQDQVGSATVTPGQTRRALDAFSTAVRRGVSDLRAITPPQKVRELHARLVAALASYEPVIATLRRASSAADAQSLIAARTRFSTGSEAVTARIQRAIGQINGALAG